ncbi:hypothetical protein ID855_10840 [Xenorhabdus sp. ZM]|uniref:hypothetical protein n=1 Tax=Xenorhabdus szentirmaii TaxID=290112 RepID=UPI0019A420DF|nr:hypothetical protein [Xenorhabdus sp. ZM]MBD2805181.1 hypothetical protein [Xenorhabdus sp. ZM]
MANTQVISNFYNLIDAGDPNYLLMQQPAVEAFGVNTLYIDFRSPGATALIKRLFDLSAMTGITYHLYGLFFHRNFNQFYKLKQSDIQHPNQPINITIDSFAEHILPLIKDTTARNSDNILLPSLLADSSLREKLNDHWISTQGYSDKQRRINAKNTITQLYPNTIQQALARQQQLEQRQGIPSQPPNLQVSQSGGMNYPALTSQQELHYPSAMASPNTFGQPPEYNQTVQFGLYPTQNNPPPASGIMRTQRAHPTVASPYNAPPRATDSNSQDIFQSLREATLSKYPGMWPPPRR